MANKKKPITIEGLALMIGKGFAGVDKRFNRVDKKLELIERRFEKVDLEISHLQASMDMARKDIGEIGRASIVQRLERLEAKVFGQAVV